MRAVVHAGEGRVRVDEVSAPRLEGPEDAIVRVRMAAVCGTDLGVLRDPEHLATGAVMGHEFVGEVVEVGPAVQHIRVGERVTGADFTACGRCWWCRSGAHWQCPERRFFGTGETFGPALSGAQAEFLRVPFADTVLQPVPAEIPDGVAVLLGDIIPTGFAAAQRAAIRPGGVTAVVGGGPVGLLASLAAQLLGSGPVVLVEPVESRRRLAATLGAIPVEPADAAALLGELTDGRGADAVLDAVGGRIGLETAFGLVRKRGSIVSIGVHHDESWPLPVARAFADELTLSFAIGDAMRDRDVYTPFVQAKLLDPTPLLSDPWPLGSAPDAYEALKAQRTVKALVAVQS